jgi:hypothetical protein
MNVRTTVAQNQLDFMAGGKAAYIEFHRRTLGTDPPKPWEKLTAAMQRRWQMVAKAATIASLNVGAAKRERRLRMASNSS